MDKEGIACQLRTTFAQSLRPTYFGMPKDGTSRFKDTKGKVLHYFLNVSSFFSVYCGGCCPCHKD